MSLCKRHRYFVIVPIFTAFIWFFSLLAMLLTWLLTGRPKYVPTQVAVVYISDIGASYLKPLFVVACILTGVGFVLSLVIERLLRHSGRLPVEHRTKEIILGRLSIVGGVVALIGLSLLSGLDTKRFPTEHVCFLLVFLVGVALSAIFTVIEFWWLAADYPNLSRLKVAYYAKAAIGFTLVALAIVFGFGFFYAQNLGGVIEWTIAFGFTFYVLTFVYDLWGAKVEKAGETSREEMTQKA